MSRALDTRTPALEQCIVDRDAGRFEHRARARKEQVPAQQAT
jgi:hypothetical protein